MGSCRASDNGVGADASDYAGCGTVIVETSSGLP